jgi:hypothetical protein
VLSQSEVHGAYGDRIWGGNIGRDHPPAPSAGAPGGTRREPLLCAARGSGLRGLAVVMAVVVLVLAGCSSAHTSARQSAANRVSTRAHPAAVVTLRTTDGAVMRVPSARPSVLLFITLGCADCAASAQSMTRAARSLRAAGSLRGQATFLAVDLDPDLPAAHLRDFLNSVGARGLPATINSDGTLIHKYHVTALSSVLIINPAGKVVYRAVNPTAHAIIRALTTAG